MNDAPLFPAIADPSPEAAEAARERHLQLTKPAGALGKLEEVSIWISACQGSCPPRDLERARVVVFAGDHGVTRSGVSAYPAEVTPQMVANILAGGAGVNVLARRAGATVRVLDISVDADCGPGDVSSRKLRRSCGSIDREDSMTADETTAAVRLGREICDEEVDGGADLLIPGDLGIGNTTPSAVLTAVVTGREPVDVIGRGTGIDDAGWARKCAAVRDAMFRARGLGADPLALLRTVASPDLAVMAGFLAQAAVRRTPVILDGLVVTSAALVAELLAPGASRWWVAGHRSAEPAHDSALEHLDLEPLLDYGMRLGEGSGAVAALPMVRSAIAVLAEMATFADAGVSTRDEGTRAGDSDPGSGGAAADTSGDAAAGASEDADRGATDEA